jgi:hypothetical protein
LRASRGFYFSKRHFWFTDAAAEIKQLDKAHATHATTAWATQTGKGLLFWAKRSEDKDKNSPFGIINLVRDKWDIGQYLYR